jgi:hypothetical protein
MGRTAITPADPGDSADEALARAQAVLQDATADYHVAKERVAAAAAVRDGEDNSDSRASLHHAQSRLVVATNEYEAAQMRAAAERARAAARAARVPEPVRDAEGFDLRPDPLAARTPTELVAALRRYREWAGQPPFRVMAARTRQKAAASTLCTALGSGEMPRLDVVVAIIAGCGGGEEDQRCFATAWRRIQFGQLDAGPAAGERALRVVPSAAEAG